MLLFLSTSLTLPLASDNQTGLASAAQGVMRDVLPWPQPFFSDRSFRLAVSMPSDVLPPGYGLNFMPMSPFLEPQFRGSDTFSHAHSACIMVPTSFARHPCSEDCATHESNAVP